MFCISWRYSIHSSGKFSIVQAALELSVAGVSVDSVKYMASCVLTSSVVY